jgi:NADH-quinone oxidoreductase subunit L
MGNIILVPVIMPLLSGLVSLFMPRRARGIFALLISLAGLTVCAFLYGKEAALKIPWTGFGIQFSLRLYSFSWFIITAAAFFTFLTVLYGLVFFRDKPCGHKFYTYILFSLGAVTGAVLADNLVVMLFFWESLLLLLFGMIAQSGSTASFKTAIKMFTIVGISDLCMMAGIGLTGRLAGTLDMSSISLIPTPAAALAFILLMIGAISKAGAMPFHTWIPDAALDAPVPFMAYFPAAAEKLLGIYFLTRICMDLFRLAPASGLSALLMVIGAATIVLAVMMALIQKDYKRLLSYHAISQVGYMILGIGTALPVGIVGGLFHMLNNALYKSCLFFTAGAVEKEAGTTDLQKLGGLASRMPVTFISFFIAALSISGVPPFNGFFSKELVYDAALERGHIFYIAAALGSFFTAASFLKLGHAAFLGKLADENKKVREAPAPMLMVMLTIALVCVLFGVYNYLPIAKLIQPALSSRLGGHNFYGFPPNLILVAITVLVLAGALIHHLICAKIYGGGLHAADDIYYFPVFRKIYEWAQKRFFDPYDMGLKGLHLLARVLWAMDRVNDWVYDKFTAGAVEISSRVLSRLHNGNYVTYLAWSVAGAVAVIVGVLCRPF